MHGDRHGLEAGPLVGPPVVVVVVGVHPGERERRILAAPDVEAAPGHHPVDPATAAEHGGRGRQGPRLWIVDFVRRRLEGRQSVGESPADDVDAAVDRRAGDVVALARQIRQHLPLIGRHVVGGEVVSARHASSGDVDLAGVRDGHPPAARRGHRRLRDPRAPGRVQLVHRVDCRGAVLIIRGLAAEQVDLPVDAGRHPVVVRLRELRPELPRVGRDVVDLHRAGRPVGALLRRIAAHDVELAARLGERELGVVHEQPGPAPPFAAGDGRVRLLTVAVSVAPRLDRGPRACGDEQSAQRDCGFDRRSPARFHRT